MRQTNPNSLQAQGREGETSKNQNGEEGIAAGGSRPTLQGFVLESLEVLEGVEWRGVVEVDFEQGLAKVVVLGGEHLQLGFGRGYRAGGAAGGLACESLPCEGLPCEGLAEAVAG